MMFVRGARVEVIAHPDPNHRRFGTITGVIEHNACRVRLDGDVVEWFYFTNALTLVNKRSIPVYRKLSPSL